MPDYPYPGTAISPQYLRKSAGFKSPPDEGINHTAGLSKQGLDNASPGVITAPNVTGITTTAATVNWTTPSMPGGSVVLMRPDGGETIYNEAAAAKTAHTAPFTGLVSGQTYSYRIVQYTVTYNQAPMAYQSGSFTTL
jgi:hypothetical protein